MPDRNCFSPILACRLRVARLDDSGAPLAGANNLVVSDALIRIGYSVVVEEGANLTQKNGCGVQCVKYQGDDKITGVNLTLELCSLDFELLEMLTGGTLVTEGGFTRGLTLPPADQELANRVSVEAWSLAWDGDEQATEGADTLTIRTIFPSTSWVEGDRTYEEGITRIPLTGRGRSNANFGDGPGNDLPWGVYVTPKGEYVDSDPMPEATCGYQSLVAS